MGDNLLPHASVFPATDQTISPPMSTMAVFSLSTAQRCLPSHLGHTHRVIKSELNFASAWNLPSRFSTPWALQTAVTSNRAVFASRPIPASFDRDDETTILEGLIAVSVQLS